MQATDQEKIQYCSIFGTFVNTKVYKQEIAIKCNNCGKKNPITCLKSADCVLCLPCVEILNVSKDIDTSDPDHDLDPVSQMTNDNYFKVQPKNEKSFGRRMMCDIR